VTEAEITKKSERVNVDEGSTTAGSAVSESEKSDEPKSGGDSERRSDRFIEPDRINRSEKTKSPELRRSEASKANEGGTSAETRSTSEGRTVEERVKSIEGIKAAESRLSFEPANSEETT
jgi:hypothetical protein